jgi:predicted double-glycine peptidase
MIEVLLLVELLFQPVPYRELRYIEVVGQTDFYTCGPAAVATLLTYYYSIPTTEAEALELAEGFMRAQDLEPAKGINALALKQTLEAKGILTKGFRVKPEALKDYFDRGGLPLIAHLTEPQKHFVVVVGFVGDQVVLGDPSWGRRTIPFSAFVKEHGYNEIVLVSLPSDPEIVRSAKERQKATLEWAADRLAHLANLREGLP